MTAHAAIPDDLVRHIVDQDTRRARRAVNAWDRLTGREQRLLKEAAVMGYLRGMWDHGPGGEKVPPDSHIVQSVIEHCQTYNDRFPYIGNLTTRRRTGRTNQETDDV